MSQELRGFEMKCAPSLVMERDYGHFSFEKKKSSIVGDINPGTSGANGSDSDASSEG
jgi:hypothetical protein